MRLLSELLCCRQLQTNSLGASYETRAEADPFFARPQVAEFMHSYFKTPTRNIQWL